jgi:hypothetical protein
MDQRWTVALLVLALAGLATSAPPTLSSDELLNLAKVCSYSVVLLF